MNLSAKSSYDDIYYTSQWGDSRYAQTELQLNSAHDFHMNSWWKLSLAADLQWDGLNSDNYDASRITAFSALASSFTAGRFAADVALEYCIASDLNGMRRAAFSPSVDFRYNILKGLDVVAFGRRAYRVPVFNELYYVGYGNPDLKPEDAWLTDVGVDFYRHLSPEWNIKAKVDGFYNLLTNKITSAPTAEDPNIWLPFNIGKVRSMGMDLVAGASYESGDWILYSDLRYSYQSAVDKTPDSYSYGQQIAYIAKHTVTADIKAAWKGYTLNPRWVWKTGRTDSAGSLADWNSLDIVLAKKITILKSRVIELNLTARNLLNSRYELVSGYPMPGRSITGGVAFCF